MPAEVILQVVRGTHIGTKYEFRDRTTCVLGRHESCGIQIQEEENPRWVSRHHCMLDINPPDVRIRDFGSKHGTYVNEELIGRRRTIEREDDAEQDQRVVTLHDGDQIRIRNTVFAVTIIPAVGCAHCGVELGPDDAIEIKPGVYHCETCQQRAKTEHPTNRQELHRNCVRSCVRCRKDVTDEVTANRLGHYVCLACRDNPLNILRSMLNDAQSGNERLQGIDGYTIVRELGRGGFGVVCLARHEATGEEVALKLMLPNVAASERATEVFLREMRTNEALRHPNVVAMRDSGCVLGTFFMSLEYCNGGPLNHFVKKRGRKLSINDASSIIFQVLDGLDFAHRQEVPVKLADGSVELRRGIVHRDLKPQNILLHHENERTIVKLGDYGMAKAFDAAGLSGHTMCGALAGTPVFMCRQQVIDFKHAKPDVDVWAAAATLYYMLTRKFPREFTKGRDVWETVLSQPVTPIRKRRFTVPKKLATVLDAALDDRRELRFKTASELRAALEKAL